MNYCSQHNSTAGFTLVELVAVIVIVGILSVMGGKLIVAPVTGYLDLSRRARLVDQADLALRRMQRDIRAALPNSVRIAGGGTALEFINTTDGGRYRRYPDASGAGDILDFSTADTSFDVLGRLSRTPKTTQFVVVYNVAPTGATGNAFSGVNRAQIGADSSDINIKLEGSGFEFPLQSPYQRFFIVDEAISYVCQAGQLVRYHNYGIPVSQSLAPVGTAALVSTNVSSCAFSYDPGTSQRAGLVTFNLTLTEAGESVTLIQQVHVVNTP